jgi:hypothetical protein
VEHRRDFRYPEYKIHIRTAGPAATKPSPPWMKAAPAAEAENSGAFGIFGWIIVVAAALGIIALVMYFVIRKKEA